MLLYFSINLIKIGQLTYDINVTCKKSEGVIPEKMNYKPTTVCLKTYTTRLLPAY